MTNDDNPLGRKYNDAEVAAARRLGINGPRGSLGPLVYATGPYWPDRARAMARDWAIVANALDREWKRDPGGNLPDGVMSTTERDAVRSLRTRVEPPTEQPASSPAPLDVESFNAAHPVGTDVLYWPGAVVGPGRRSRTRTPAWELSGHAVVSVEDYPGGVLLDHVNTVDSPPLPEVEEAELGGPAGVLGYVYTCTRCRWTATAESSMVSARCPRCSARMSRRTPEDEQ